MKIGILMLVGMATGNLIGVVLKYGFAYGGVALVLLIGTAVLYFGEQIYYLRKSKFNNHGKRNIQSQV